MTVVQRVEAPVDATDPAAIRRILGPFCTGIVIVTAIADAVPVGMTCQSFSSLSLDPPLILFSASHTSTSWPRIRHAGTFAVNILADDQEALCRRFASSGADKFLDVEWSPGAAGAPLLAGCLAHRVPHRVRDPGWRPRHRDRRTGGDGRGSIARPAAVLPQRLRSLSSLSGHDTTR